MPTSTGLTNIMFPLIIVSFFVVAIQEGSTCVHIAAMKGSVSVMKELLKFNPSGITTARNKVKSRTNHLSRGFDSHS